MMRRRLLQMSAQPTDWEHYSSSLRTRPRLFTWFRFSCAKHSLSDLLILELNFHSIFVNETLSLPRSSIIPVTWLKQHKIKQCWSYTNSTCLATLGQHSTSDCPDFIAHALHISLWSCGTHETHCNLYCTASLSDQGVIVSFTPWSAQRLLYLTTCQQIKMKWICFRYNSNNLQHCQCHSTFAVLRCKIPACKDYLSFNLQGTSLHLPESDAKLGVLLVQSESTCFPVSRRTESETTIVFSLMFSKSR